MDSQPKSDFRPPQASPQLPASLKILSGTAPLQIAQACVNYLTAVTPNSVLHDNGCGNGNVTCSLLHGFDEAQYPKLIHATDVSKELLDKLSTTVKENGWPVITQLMAAESLTFPDEFFTHSITNCVIFRLSDSEAVTACHHIRRTLKKGGVAIISCWGFLPHRHALEAAHRATRLPSAPPLVGGITRWEDGTLLRRCLEDAGFIDHLRIEKAIAVIEVDDLAEWIKLAWSFLGRTEKGWLEDDEKIGTRPSECWMKH